MTATFSQRTSIAPTSTPLLHGAFLAMAATPDATALICDDHAWRYAEIARRASFVAEQLRGAGACRGKIVAILADHGWQEVVGVLGVLGAGAAYLALDPLWSPHDKRRLLDGAAADIVVAASGTVEGSADATLAKHRRLVLIDTCVPPPGYVAKWSPSPSPDDLACVTYTGEDLHGPLYGRYHHRTAAAFLQQMNARLAVLDDDEILRVAPLGATPTVYDLFGVLSAGGTIIAPGRLDATSPARCLDLIDDYGVTILETGAASALALVDAATHGHRSPLLSLRLVILAGRAIPAELTQRISWLLPAARVVALWGERDAATGAGTERVDELDRSRRPD